MTIRVDDTVRSADNGQTPITLGSESNRSLTNPGKISDALTALENRLANSNSPFTTAERESLRAFIAIFNQHITTQEISDAARDNYQDSFDTLASETDYPNGWTDTGVTITGSQVAGLHDNWDKIIFMERATNRYTPTGNANDGIDLFVVSGVPLIRLIYADASGTGDSYNIAYNDYVPAHTNTDSVNNARVHLNRQAGSVGAGDITFDITNNYPSDTVRDPAPRSYIGIDVELSNFTGSDLNVDLPISQTGTVTIPNTFDNITRTHNIVDRNGVTQGVINVRVTSNSGNPRVRVNLTNLRQGLTVSAITVNQFYSYTASSTTPARNHWVYLTDENGDIDMDADTVSKFGLVNEFQYEGNMIFCVPVIKIFNSAGTSNTVNQCSRVTLDWNEHSELSPRTLAFGTWATRTTTRPTDLKFWGADKYHDVAHYLNHAQLAVLMNDDNYGRSFLNGLIPFLEVMHAGIDTTESEPFQVDYLDMKGKIVTLNDSDVLSVDGDAYATQSYVDENSGGGGGGGGSTRTPVNFSISRFDLPISAVAVPGTEVNAGMTLTLPEGNTLGDLDIIQFRFKFLPINSSDAIAGHHQIVIPVRTVIGTNAQASGSTEEQFSDFADYIVPLVSRGAAAYVLAFINTEDSDRTIQASDTSISVRLLDVNSPSHGGIAFDSTVAVAGVSPHVAIGVPL